MMSQNDNCINGSKGSGDCVGSIVWSGRCPRVSQPGLGRNPASAKRRIKKMLIGCWNVRTLSDLPASSKRLERRTALISRELQRYNLDIVALSETRLTGEGNVSDEGYTFFWKGKPHGSKKESGVAFAVKTSLLSYLEKLPCGINDLILSMRVPLTRDQYATFVSFYAPTIHTSEETKMAFYQGLRQLVAKIPPADKVVILGDFNARVGKDAETWHVLGKHGVVKLNSNGLMLLQFCTEMEFQLTNTMFQMKDKFKTTWMHPRSKQWHFIDFLLVRRRDIVDVQIVRAMRGAECWTDHRLVRGKVKPRSRSCVTKLPKSLNVAGLKNAAVKEKLVREMKNTPCENSWEDFKVSVYSVCERVLDFRKRKNRD